MDGIMAVGTMMTDATPEQIVAFLTQGAQAVVEGHMAITTQEYNELKAEIERLRTALQFYADDLHYRGLPVDVLVDHGDMARAALEPKPMTREPG